MGSLALLDSEVIVIEVELSGIFSLSSNLLDSGLLIITNSFLEEVSFALE